MLCLRSKRFCFTVQWWVRSRCFISHSELLVGHEERAGGSMAAEARAKSRRSAVLQLAHSFIIALLQALISIQFPRSSLDSRRWLLAPATRSRCACFSKTAPTMSTGSCCVLPIWTFCILANTFSRRRSARVPQCFAHSVATDSQELSDFMRTALLFTNPKASEVS